MMLSTPVASAQHAHAQLPRVRSTHHGFGSSRNRRRHPVWMALVALATKKVLRRCGAKRQWVAPTISVNLGGDVDKAGSNMANYLGS